MPSSSVSEDSYSVIINKQTNENKKKKTQGKSFQILKSFIVMDLISIKNCNIWICVMELMFVSTSEEEKVISWKKVIDYLWKGF